MCSVGSEAGARMIKPDVGIKVAESGAEALEKTGRAFCPVHGLVGHRLKSGRWSVVTCFTDNGKRPGKLLWTSKLEPPVKCPLCEAE